MRQPLRFAAMTAVRAPGGRLNRAVTIDLYLGICLMGALLVLVAPGAAQVRFRITYTVQSRDARATVLAGQVFNDTGVDVFDVWVTAEALSASGKVVGKGIAFVASSISRGVSAPFEVKVPAGEGVETLRIAVTSYRAGREVQSP